MGRRAADLVPRALTRGAAIRPAAPADAAAIVELGRAIDRDQIATEASFRALLERTAPATTERLVAEIDSRVIAWAPSGTYASGSGWFWIGVDASCRRRGIGVELYRRIESRLADLGATRLETTPNDGEGRAFLLARGFEVANVMRASELDPRTVPAPTTRADVGVVPLGAALEHAHALFRLYAEARDDVPSDSPRSAWTFDEWRAETIDLPLIDLDASVVVLEGGEPVALAWLCSDREGHRAEMLMTATRRDRRGRGLATLAKAASARRAAELGITRILTGNDRGNAPMLAVNRKLGFTATAVVESLAKRLA
ncbi:MAG TPA: GNAT family N-acetyltransferase [Gaiellaceae bacterium]|nr:GNAT family N-acetyltransferase [Gaiellaceae bacterium]